AVHRRATDQESGGPVGVVSAPGQRDARVVAGIRAVHDHVTLRDGGDARTAGTRPAVEDVDVAAVRANVARPVAERRADREVRETVAVEIARPEERDGLA